MEYKVKRFSNFSEEEKLSAGISKSPIYLNNDVIMEGIKGMEMWRTFKLVKKRKDSIWSTYGTLD